MGDLFRKTSNHQKHRQELSWEGQLGVQVTYRDGADNQRRDQDILHRKNEEQSIVWRQHVEQDKYTRQKYLRTMGTPLQ